MRKNSSGFSPRRTLVALLAFALLCTPSQAAGGNEQGGAHDNRDRTLVVMTRNMYLGTDFSGVFSAASDGELVGAVGAAYGNVRSSNVPARVAAMAEEIAGERPALVSLQEVALWRTGAFLNPAPADTTTYDFLQILLDQLAARGLHYAPVAVVTNFQAEAPAFVAPAQFVDVSFTDRDAVLARTDLSTSELKIESATAQNFQTVLPLPTAGPLGTIVIPRGWIAVDAKLRGKSFRFVATHLESFHPAVQYGQALELLAGPLDTSLPVILAGDLNSDAESANPMNAATYLLLVGNNFIDAWDATRTNEAGHTWPLFESSPFEFTPPRERLDFVLARGNLAPLATELVGDENVTPGVPMPSDHAGLAASFRLLP